MSWKIYQNGKYLSYREPGRARINFKILHSRNFFMSVPALAEQFVGDGLADHGFDDLPKLVVL